MDEIHQDIFLKLVAWAVGTGGTKRRDPVAVFLYGGPGVGKTTLAYRVCEAANLRAVECNASHVRNRAGVSEIIQPLLKSNNVRNVSHSFRVSIRNTAPLFITSHLLYYSYRIYHLRLIFFSNLSGS